MDKLERIVSVPACYIDRQAADQIATRIKTVAEEQAVQDYQLALQQFSARLGIGVSDLLTRVPDIGRYLYARKDQVTVLSPHGNVQYTGRDVSYDELPNDPMAVFVNVPGANGRLVTVTFNADVMQNPSLQQVNKILIQGSDRDRDWVNGQYE